MAGVAAAGANRCAREEGEEGEEGASRGGRQPSRWGRGCGRRWLVIGRPSMLVATDMLFGRPRIRSAPSSAGSSIASRVGGRSRTGRRQALLNPLALLGRAASMAVPSGRPEGSSLGPGRWESRVVPSSMLPRNSIEKDSQK